MEGNTALKIEETKETEFANEGLALLMDAKALKVTDETSLGVCAGMIKKFKERQKDIKGWFAPMLTAAKAVVDEINGKQKRALQPWADGETYCRQVQDAFLTEQHRLKHEAERKLAIENAKIAEKERQALLAKAAKAEDKGKTETAAELLSQAEEVVAAPAFVVPTVAKTVKTDGAAVTGRVDVEVTVTDMVALCKAIGEGKVPPTVVGDKVAPLKAFVKQWSVKSGMYGLHVKEIVSGAVR